jgi:stearoyl-CoA desaturase (delta-9 desaturase)
MERYGHGTPDDWIERHLYSRFAVLGLTLMGLIDVVLLGFVPGVLVLATQIVWIPFWAAGVINGIGHFWGYRNWGTEDASTNIVPWGILIGGEELHNNHHAYATSAKLSNKWYELDIGWMYIRILEALGLAKVKKVAPTPRFTEEKAVDLATLQAVITHRYDVLATYAKSLKRTYAEELGKLRRFAPHDAHVLQSLKRWLHRDERSLCETERADLNKGLAKSRALHTVYSMRAELVSLWERSSASREQLVRQLQDWCHRAEASGICHLEQFSRRLRCYAA